MSDVIEAVAAIFDTPDPTKQLSQNRLSRQVVAFIAFEDGLIRQTEISAALGGRSRGSAGFLIGCCRVRMEKDPALRELVAAARTRMRRRPVTMITAPNEFTYRFHRRRDYIPGAP